LNLRQAFEIAADSNLIALDEIAPNGDLPHHLVDFIGLGHAFQAASDRISQIGDQTMMDPARVALEDVMLLAPLSHHRKNVFCVGSNYRAHVTEASRAQNKTDKTPDYPVFFSKPPTSVIGPDDAIRLDPAVSDKVDYEVELAIVFGTQGRNIREEDADTHIFGVTIINDVTARDLQRRHGGQFLKGKGQDTFCPMGPCIVTLDELGRYDDLSVRTWVNGELRQDGNTGHMIFSVPRLIASLSEGMTLEPGDILATGTPSGVGYAMDPPRYLGHGDQVTCAIQNIGELSNTVADAAQNRTTIAVEEALT